MVHVALWPGFSSKVTKIKYVIKLDQTISSILCQELLMRFMEIAVEVQFLYHQDEEFDKPTNHLAQVHMTLKVIGHCFIWNCIHLERALSFQHFQFGIKRLFCMDKQKLGS